MAKTVSIHQRSVEAFIRKGPVLDYMKKVGERVAKRARELAPVGDYPPYKVSQGTYGGPKLRDSIRARVVNFQSGPVIFVESLSPKALPVHEGSRVHTISPSGAPRLAFVGTNDGRLVVLGVGKSVTHRMSKVGAPPRKGAQPFLVEALEATRGHSRSVV